MNAPDTIARAAGIALEATLQEAEAYAVGIMRAEGIDDTGATTRGITSKVGVRGPLAEGLFLGTGPAAVFVEEDTKAGVWRPLDPLKAWVRRKLKGGARGKRAYAKQYGYDTKGTRGALDDDFEEEVESIARGIQRKQFHHGTKGRHVMERALNQALPGLHARLQRDVPAAIARSIAISAGRASNAR